MTRSGRRDQALAIVLAGLAGFVDATGFLAFGGFFVSFMSGNTTRLGVGLGGHIAHDALEAAGLIGTFVAGVLVGALVGGRAGRWQRPAVLGTVAALLAVAAASDAQGFPIAAAGAAVLAMGAENAVFERGGEPGIGLTYMTGTLVKTGQGLAQALTGGKRWGWLPHALLWAGFALGAITGAASFPALGLSALGWAAAAFAVLGVATATAVARG